MFCNHQRFSRFDQTHAKGTSSIFASVRVINVFPVPVGPLLHQSDFSTREDDSHHEDIALFNLHSFRPPTLIAVFAPSRDVKQAL